MKGPRGNEQDVIGLHHAVFGGNGGALDQRQQIALHTLARHVGTTAFRARSHLVNFVNEDNAVLLEHVQRLRLDVFLVDQFGRFFIDQQFHRFGDFELACLALGLTHLTEHATQLLGHFFHAGRTHDLQLRR